MGKSHLLHSYVSGNPCDFKASSAGKKMFNSEHESDQIIFLKVR